ncbi:protein FAM47E isoform X5 [Ictidomys tridecemlineatus]|uniref:protein FAM47E isoform X6 n=1 Tax=Ictidomys tridecemlineatus TaxID=43179 RepID=UPI001A9F40E9|nr:protein FAM47E isoform X6 [Ictidomys tridecemlineatus]
MTDCRRLLRSGTLAPVPERRYCGPGYKEHLPSGYFTVHRRLKFPSSLNSQRWVFVGEGLDFRKGCRPCGGLMAQGPKESFLPMIHHGVPPLPSKKRPNELLSRLSWAQRARKAFVEDVEARLALHPLALHPHLEEAMPAQLLLQVLEVLDPERKLEDTWAYCQDTKKGTKEPTKLSKNHSTQVCLGLPKKTPMSHSGQWLYEEKPSKRDVLHEDGPLLHENVRREVSDFCKWATTLGSSNIDEEFILKQFDLGYQSKPPCDVLRVMRLNQVPLELKKSVGLNKLQEADFFQKRDHERTQRKPQFLEKIYIGKKDKCAYNKTPIKLT